MGEPLPVGAEYSMRREQSQNAMKSVWMRIDGGSEFRRRFRKIVDCIGNAQIGHDVKAPRQTIAAGHLLQYCEWISFRHFVPILQRDFR
jgi:hypothetical protein